MNEYKINNFSACIRYHDLPGDEIPILFIHGLGCAGSFDYPQVAAQKTIVNHRRILVDLLGAGFSDRPKEFSYTVLDHALYLKEFLEDLKIKKFIIYGHSLGGAVAIELARLCTQKVHALILAESNLDPSEEGSYSKTFASYTEEDFIQEGFQKMLLQYKNGDNAIWVSSLAQWLPLAAYRISRNAVEGGRPSWRSILYDLAVNKSFIMGEYSLTEIDTNELMQHNIHIEVVNEAGHSMAWENPFGLAKAIANCML